MMRIEQAGEVGIESEPQSYRRQVTEHVTARRVPLGAEPERVNIPTGKATANPGDWIVTAANGQTNVLADAMFRKAYDLDMRGLSWGTPADPDDMDEEWIKWRLKHAVPYWCGKCGCWKWQEPWKDG